VTGYVAAGSAESIVANSFISGAVEAFAVISLSTKSKTADLVEFSPSRILPNVQSEGLSISKSQTTLTQIGSGKALSTTMTTDTTLYAGMYSVANLSKTAGTVIKSDGQNKPDQVWIFNIQDYLFTGASTNMLLINGDSGDRIIWNRGDYKSLGVSSRFTGTIFEHTYVSVGANANLMALVALALVFFGDILHL
jgi:hypothetical protein